MQSPLLQGLSQAYNWNVNLRGIITLCSPPSVDLSTLLVPQLIAMHLKAGQRVCLLSVTPVDESALSLIVRRIGVDLSMSKAEGKFTVKKTSDLIDEAVLILDGLWLWNDEEFVKHLSWLQSLSAPLIYAVTAEPSDSKFTRYLIHQSMACLMSVPLNSNLNRDLHGELSLVRGGQVTAACELKFRSLLFKTSDTSILFFPKGGNFGAA